ncbi:MAG: copper oxidase [Deltaproteobacteria bacterium]|nr:copper oxidase [Deltaproteobacteria bacterium]
MSPRVRWTVGRLAAWCGIAVSLAGGAACSSSGDDYVAPEFAEPVTLASENGVLEVSLFVRQGEATLDTVDIPVHNFLLFGYEVLQGTASNGETVGDNLYPGPTLQVYPGETLIVHVANELADLTIGDFYDPAFIRRADTPPLYPRQLTSSPFNLHTHGLHVPPAGNADNVLLDIPSGYTNTYTYDVPDDHPEGMYWYHSHRHTLTAQHTYLGLAGMLSIGRSDGNIPAVTENALPIRNMAIQYNWVFDRQGGQAVLNDVNWPQYVSTLIPPTGPPELEDGTYVPKLAPLNFSSSEKGTQYYTNWYAGPLSESNNRGQYQFLPQNLISFKAHVDGDDDVPADPSLPDHLRDLQFTINGQFQPVIRAKPGQTEIWVLANISDFAYTPLTLTETATGNHPVIPLLGQDGNPYPEVHYPTTGGGTTLLIPPATRYAIAVTMPSEGGLVLEMPAASTQAPLSREGILYTSDGTEYPPAVLGTLSVDPSALSYYDGFFVSPTQVLARMEPEEGTGVTVAFVEGQAVGAYTSFVDTEGLPAAVTRELVVSGGFLNEHASTQDPKAFVYAFDDNAFPYIPLLQPRLNTIEEWTFINGNNDEHPMHIHVNDFQVSEYYAPNENPPVHTFYQPWGQDNANLASPIGGEHPKPEGRARLSVRTEFQEYSGTYVVHCHRLNHEDNGLMAIINVIPEITSFAVASPGSAGAEATVRVYDGSENQLLAEIVPFPGWEGDLSVAMGDVNGDQILDVIAAKGPGGEPEVIALSGAQGFDETLVDFLAYDASFTGGVRVAAADIDGNALADNVIAASGPGVVSNVTIFGSVLPEVGDAPEVFASFSPYPDSATGVTIATGLLDVHGRYSIITAPGPGDPAQIKTFRFDLYKPNTGVSAWCAPTDPLPEGVPLVTSEFLAFEESYQGGVSLAAGWIGGAYGGAQSIVVGESAGPGVVKVFGSGSALDGEPLMYLESPDDHDPTIEFFEISRFTPFGDAPSSGVRVAVTSNELAADVLASGLDSSGTEVLVRKYFFVRSDEDERRLSPEQIAQVESAPGTEPSWLGGF